MPDTVGGFNDLVQLSGDTLYHLGEEFLVGNTAASTVTIGFSNSAGILALAAAQTGNETINLPSGGTLLSNINVSAGTTSSNVSAITFKNDGGPSGVSFGFDGANITASIGTFALAAGTQTVTQPNDVTILFQNSNNISFGMSGSNGNPVQITASYNFNLSAGTTSNNLNAVTFSNSNGISFGLNGSVVTGSVATSLTNINISAGTTSNNLSNVVFSNSNNVSFGLSGSTVTASGGVIFSGGANSINLTSIIFSNFNNVGFVLAGSTMVASAFISVSQGGNNVNATEIVFSNSNNVSFGISNAGGNEVIVTASASVATSLTNINISAGTTSNNLSAVTFSNSNGVSFGLNGSVVTGSVATSLTNINISAGTTSNNLSAVTFSNSNGISFGLNGSVVTASDNSLAIAAGTQTASSGSTVVFSNSNGFSFGMSGSTRITAAYGGFSSWSAGPVNTTFASSSAFLSLQPIVVPYEITVTNVVWIANATASATNASGGITVSAGLYTINAGNTGSLSIASSSSTALTFTSGAALSSYTGVAYRQMAVSWALTPGPYVFAFAAAPINAASFTFNGIHNPSAINFASGLGAAMSNMILPGISASSVGAIPNSIGITNTSGYLRTGSQALNQPWFLFQGT
jgi:hypothetical protein